MAGTSLRDVSIVAWNPGGTLTMEREEILREITSLKKKVRALSKENKSLKAALIEDPSPAEKMLRMRGMKVFQKNPTDQLFFPPDLSLFYKARFYKMMTRYSFRLVWRDMIKSQDRVRIQDLTHYCSLKVAKKYCDLLCEMGVIEKNGKEGFRTFISPLYSFGQTLEWFVAEMFKREFASPAIYGVTVKGTASGGDYDVITSWNRRLVSVEVKSSPPKGIELSEVSTFFSRMDDLMPEIAVFFNDTQLRMKDKLVVMFEEELEKRYGGQSKSLYPVERLVEKLFPFPPPLFIVN